MIDIHCHPLPGLDDGAKDMAEALAMARMAVADGVRLAVATPHITPGSYDNDAEQIAHAVDVLKGALVANRIPLILGSAAEIRLSGRLLRAFRQGRMPVYNVVGVPRYYLLEFPHRGIRPGSLYLAELLRHQGYCPIIAHPERIQTIVDCVETMAPYIRLGGCGQLTASSLCGGFGDQARRVAEELLHRGWIGFLASDGHGFHQRQMVLSDGVKAAASLVGVRGATSLVDDNPRRLLAGVPPVPVLPLTVVATGQFSS